MAAGENEGVVEFTKFTGLRNNAPADEFEHGDLTDARNIDITDAGRARRRRGSSAIRAVGKFEWVWADGGLALAVRNDTELVRIEPDYTVTALRSDLTAGARMTYARFGNVVFYSNGRQFGKVVGGESSAWGVNSPGYQGYPSEIGGALEAGRYLFAVTFVRADGREGGTGPSGQATISANGALKINALPVPPDSDVEFKNVYVSAPNGETMYLAGTIPAETQSFTLATLHPLTVPLRTQFLSPPPPGFVLASFNGHMLVAHGETLYRSETYQPELFDFRKGLRFGSDIQIVAPVAGGVYLGTRDRVVFLEGDDPAGWKLSDKFDYGAIPGTLAYVSADKVADGSQTGNAAVFATTKGICVGFDGGAIKNLTQGKFAYPVQDRGAGVTRQTRGIEQYVVTMQGDEETPDESY